MKLAICFVLFLTLPSVLLASYRPVDIQKEIQTANYVGEVIFIGYDSTLVSRYSDFLHPIEVDSITGEVKRVENHDSVWVISKIYYKRMENSNDSIYSANLMNNRSWNRYLPRPDSLPSKRVSNGYWPRINENCLIVIDSLGAVSIFGSIEETKYVFWDPYPNAGWNTVFAFDAPFEYYPVAKKNSYKSSPFTVTAKFLNCEYACQFHCSIEKKLLWEMISK